MFAGLEQTVKFLQRAQLGWPNSENTRSCFSDGERADLHSLSNQFTPRIADCTRDFTGFGRPDTVQQPLGALQKALGGLKFW